MGDGTGLPIALRQGDIVKAEIVDKQGRNPKPRPVAIITPTDEISNDDIVVVAALTGTLTYPIPDTHVLLPWQNGGHVVTGLNRKTVLVCDWLAEVKVEEILEKRGRIPDYLMSKVLTHILSDGQSN